MFRKSPHSSARPAEKWLKCEVEIRTTHKEEYDAIHEAYYRQLSEDRSRQEETQPHIAPQKPRMAAQELKTPVFEDSPAATPVSHR